MMVGARNLGTIMRKLFGIGTPRGFQGSLGAVLASIIRSMLARPLMEMIIFASQAAMFAISPFSVGRRGQAA